MAASVQSGTAGVAWSQKAPRPAPSDLAPPRRPSSPASDDRKGENLLREVLTEVFRRRFLAPTPIRQIRIDPRTGKQREVVLRGGRCRMTASPPWALLEIGRYQIRRRRSNEQTTSVGWSQ